MNSRKNFDEGNYKRAVECLQELPTALIRRLIKSDEILTTQGKKALRDTLRKRRTKNKIKKTCNFVESSV